MFRISLGDRMFDRIVLYAAGTGLGLYLAMLLVLPGPVHRMWRVAMAIGAAVLALVLALATAAAVNRYYREPRWERRISKAGEPHLELVSANMLRARLKIRIGAMFLGLGLLLTVSTLVHYL